MIPYIKCAIVSILVHSDISANRMDCAKLMVSIFFLIATPFCSTRTMAVQAPNFWACLRGSCVCHTMSLVHFHFIFFLCWYVEGTHSTSRIAQPPIDHWVPCVLMNTFAQSLSISLPYLALICLTVACLVQNTYRQSFRNMKYVRQTEIVFCHLHCLSRD